MVIYLIFLQMIFLTYLPNGFDVFYQSIPPHISDLLNDKKTHGAYKIH